MSGNSPLDRLDEIVLAVDEELAGERTQSVATPSETQLAPNELQHYENVRKCLAFMERAWPRRLSFSSWQNRLSSVAREAKSFASFLRRQPGETVPIESRWPCLRELLKSAAHSKDTTPDSDTEVPACLAKLVEDDLLSTDEAHWLASDGPARWQTCCVDRFLLVGLLGRGGMGVVYRALDLQSLSYCALKTWHTFDGVSIGRLKREFRRLADFNHPHLVRLGELHGHDERWFFTMELADAGNFLSHVRNADGVLLDRLPNALAQLTIGLRALHERGLVHRDIKPTNVLLSRTGEIKIADFGIVREQLLGEDDADVARYIAGTWLYMSPEQSTSGTPTIASDWYSVGVMLYEALTGRLPFPGRYATAMRDRVRFSPVPPNGLNPTVPAALNQLCMDLLSVNPSSRANGDAILSWAEANGASISSLALLSPSADIFVGRNEILKALDEVVAQVDREKLPAWVHVVGQSGLGKSALLKHWSRLNLRSESHLVLTARSRYRENVPFNACDEWLDALVKLIKAKGVEHLSAIAADISQVGRILPVFRSIRMAHANVEYPQLPQDQRRIAFESLTRILRHVAKNRTLVLILDDVQWGDRDSVELLAAVTIISNDLPLAIVLSHRLEDEIQSPFLGALNEVVGDQRHRIEVGPLSDGEAAELLRAVRADSSDIIASERNHEAKGNPYFLRELVREHAVSTAVDNALTAPTSLDDLLWNRLRRLDPNVRAAAEILAVATRPLGSDILSKALALRGTFHHTNELCNDERLIRVSKTDEQQYYELYHDRLRETLLNRTDDERIRCNHLLLADILETQMDTDPESLAIHYHGAGRLDKATEYAILAAQRANESLAFDSAVRWYRSALEWGGNDRGDRLQLRTLLADSLVNSGRAELAAEEYLSISEDTSDSTTRRELRRQAAELYIRADCPDRGAPLLTESAKAYGWSMSRPKWQVVLSIMWWSFRVRLASTPKMLSTPGKPFPEGLQGRMYFAERFGHWLRLSDILNSTDLLLQFAWLALRSDDSNRRARALAHLGNLAGLQGDRQRRARLQRLALSLSRNTSDQDTKALSVFFAGANHHNDGKFALALRYFKNALGIRRNTIDLTRFDVDCFAIRCYYFLGQLQAIRQLSIAELTWANDRGDRSVLRAAITWYGVFGVLVEDNAAEATRRLEQAHANSSALHYDLAKYVEFIARLHVELYLGNAKSAWDRIQLNWPWLETTFLRHVRPARVELWDLRARVAILCAQQNRSSGHFQREAQDAITKLQREATAKYVAPLLNTLRAGLASLRGQDQLAISHLREALTAFDRLGMRLHATAIRRQLAVCLDNHEGSSHLIDAKRWEEEEQVVNPERFAQMIVPGFMDSIR